MTFISGEPFDLAQNTPHADLCAMSYSAGSVLAVVVCGLFMSQVTPRITGALTRQVSVPFWTVSTTVLSSVLFVLVGLQAQTAIRDLSSVSLVQAVRWFSPPALRSMKSELLLSPASNEVSLGADTSPMVIRNSK